jgi:hypothetical protein
VLHLSLEVIVDLSHSRKIPQTSLSMGVERPFPFSLEHHTVCDMWQDTIALK